MSLPADVQLAWCAGLMDGEGCITVQIDRQRPNPRLRPHIQVTNTNLVMLQRFAEIMGCGCVRAKTIEGRRQQAYVWVVEGAAALAALRKLEPFLIGKRLEALTLLEFELQTTRIRIAPEEQERRYQIYLRLQALKRNEVAA